MADNTQPEGCLHAQLQVKLKPDILFSDAERKIVSGYCIEVEVFCGICGCPMGFPGIDFEPIHDNTKPTANETFTSVILPLRPVKKENKIVKLPNNQVN